jgi:CDGSH-type Zn-finger protein
MPDPTIAQKAPSAVEVESGKSYFWCAWGRSAKQPFCDGSHKGTEFIPVRFDAAETTSAYFCGANTAAPRRFATAATRNFSPPFVGPHRRRKLAACVRLREPAAEIKRCRFVLATN